MTGVDEIGEISSICLTKLFTFSRLILNAFATEDWCLPERKLVSFQNRPLQYRLFRCRLHQIVQYRWNPSPGPRGRLIRERLVDLGLISWLLQVWLTFLPSSSFVFVQSSRQALLILVLWLQKNGHQVFLWVWLRVWPVLEAGCAMYCISTEAFSACRV